jgi:predicted alpha/beta hydrolase
MENITFDATDGFALKGTLIHGNENSHSIVVLISSAMAVKQSFYYKFAKHLVQNKIKAVLTYDYRGIGDSLPLSQSLSQFNARITDFALKDQPAAIDFLTTRFPSHQLIVVGHSIGGLIIPLAPNRSKISRALIVSAMSGFYPQLKKPWTDYYLFSILNLILCSVYGYFPAKSLGLFEDLPQNVSSQWLSWMSKKDYITHHPNGKERYQSFDKPVMAIWAVDDELGKVSGFTDMIQWFKSTTPNIVLLDTNEFKKIKKIGHFGFFILPDLWPLGMKWIIEQQTPLNGFKSKL